MQAQFRDLVANGVVAYSLSVLQGEVGATHYRLFRIQLLFYLHLPEFVLLAMYFKLLGGFGPIRMGGEGCVECRVVVKAVLVAIVR